MTKYESEVKLVEQSQQAMYERLSDLRNLEALRSRLSDPTVREAMASQIPDGKAADVAHILEETTFDADTLSVKTPIGVMTLRVVEREEPKLVKFASEGSPVPMNLWIQLLPHNDNQCKMRVTVGAEVNIFLRGMLAKPLQQAADGLANILAQVR